VLAATLVPSWGVYSGYELCENEPASDTNEEYLSSEKYEIKVRDWQRADSLAPFLTRLNEIRRARPALQRLRGLQFHSSSNDHILAYSRTSADGDDVVLCVVNLDPDQVHEDTLWLDLGALGLPPTIEAHDELSGATFAWDQSPYVRLDPAESPAHVLHLRPR
jgi:starch synthase (maltosyl-transferring)